MEKDRVEYLRRIFDGPVKSGRLKIDHNLVYPDNINKLLRKKV